VLHFCCFLCIRLCKCCLTDFFECLLLFTCILVCPSSVSIFVAISMFSHAWNYFAWMFAQPANSLTHMHVDLFVEFDSCFACTIYHFCYHLVLPCIHWLDFSCPSESRANLCPSFTFTKAALRNLGNEGWPSSLDLCIPTQHWPPGLFCAFLEDSGCLAQEIVQICPWASSPSQLELHSAQSQQLVARLDYALCSSSNHSVSQ